MAKSYYFCWHSLGIFPLYSFIHDWHHHKEDKAIIIPTVSGEENIPWLK